MDWEARLNIPVSLSSCEAELVGLTNCATNAVWIRKLLRALGVDCTEPVVIQEDNQGCIAIATNQRGMSGRTKHVATRYFAVRQFVDDGEISVVYTPSADQVSDIFTKPLVAILFYKCVCMLKLVFFAAP